MRVRVLLLALISVMASSCRTVKVQQEQSNSPVSLKELSADMIAKVKAYDRDDYYKLEKGILHVQIIDPEYFKERSWSPFPSDPTEGTARIRINYYPGRGATSIIRHNPGDQRQTGL